MLNKITSTVLGKEVSVFWNYRAMKRIKNDETIFFVTEVYYHEDGSVLGWTEGKDAWGEDIEELRQSLTWMLEALDKPVLDEAALLEEAEVSRENGAEDLWNSERLTIDEVLDSLGLEREDIEGD
jgi:hypothetical protein